MEMSRGGAEAATPDFEARIAAAVESIRPALQAHGGDIELLAVVGRDARVRLVGACVG